MSSLFSLLGRSTLRPAIGALRYNKQIMGTSFPKNTPLSPKRANREYYKGNATRSAGMHTDHGRFIVLDSKKMVIDAPDLTGFKLKPYVAYSTPLVK